MSEPHHRTVRTHEDFLEKEGPEWLEKEAMTNPIVYYFYIQWRKGFCTWEQMLEGLVKKLLELNALHVETLHKLALCENTVYVMPDGKREMRFTPPKVKK